MASQKAAAGDKEEGAVGDKEGNAAGDKEGGAVEDKEGAAVGDKEVGPIGDKEMGPVGDKKVSAVGDKEEGAVGEKEGSAVGDKEGSAVGDKEGNAVGDKEGSAVGDKEGGHSCPPQYCLGQHLTKNAKDPLKLDSTRDDQQTKREDKEGAEDTIYMKMEVPVMDCLHVKQEHGSHQPPVVLTGRSGSASVGRKEIKISFDEKISVKQEEDDSLNEACFDSPKPTEQPPQYCYVKLRDVSSVDKPLFFSTEKQGKSYNLRADRKHKFQPSRFSPAPSSAIQISPFMCTRARVVKTPTID
ncbi:hypothetical protein FHG87_003097 [Trinorchestia longiramus]|nr:hypothetical protein FHG87_003097 [Trinorchestia longiramus]